MGIDGTVVRVDSGSRIDLLGTTMLAGIAGKRSDFDGSLLFGGFLEAGFADYRVHGHFAAPNRPSISGRGDLRSYGAGLMARQRWTNGFRLEGSARAGRLENRFLARKYVAAPGKVADYDFGVPYFAAHAGLGSEWQLSDASSLDFLARYFWARQNGETVSMSTGEEVTFKHDDSHRLRAGAR